MIQRESDGKLRTLKGFFTHADGPAVGFDEPFHNRHAQWYSESFVEALEDYAFIIDESGEPTRQDLSAYGQILAELGEFEQALEPLERSIKIAEEEQDQTGLAYSLNGQGRAWLASNDLWKLSSASRSHSNSKPITHGCISTAD